MAPGCHRLQKITQASVGVSSKAWLTAAHSGSCEHWPASSRVCVVAMTWSVKVGLGGGAQLAAGHLPSVPKPWAPAPVVGKRASRMATSKIPASGDATVERLCWW